MEKEIKIKVGDKVLLKNRRGKNWNDDGNMDKYMGKVVTIAGFGPICNANFYIEEDKDDEQNKNTFIGRWLFNIDDVEKVITDDFEKVITDDFKLSDLQFADIVTTRNGERYVVGDDRIIGENKDYWLDCDTLFDIFDDDLTHRGYSYYGISERDPKYDIMKVERAGQVVYERIEKAEEPVKEMTLAEICEALGYEVKVIKEDK